MEELLVEVWGVAGSAGDSSVMIESVDNGTGALYIEGVFLQAEVVNRNKRRYPKKVLKEAVDKYIREQVNTRQSLGELNHPPRANVDPLHAALMIEHMEWRGNDVWGRARIVEGDCAEGDKLAALIRSGWVPGVSSRGLGTVKADRDGVNVVQEGFKLTVGVDAVWGPSAPNAYVKPVFESNENQPLNNSISDDNAFKALTEALKHSFNSKG